jgi:hypothetical protein
MDIVVKQQVIHTLLKSKGVVGLKARLVFAIDRSASTKHLYDNHTIQKLIERLVPLAGVLDDSGAMDAYIFEDGVKKLDTKLTIDNYSGFIDRVVDDLPYGGTKYTPLINAVIRDIGATKTEVVTYMKAVKRGGLMGLFGKDSAKETKETIHVHPSGKTKVPTLVICFTDGDNDSDDKEPAYNAMVSASKYPAFWQFLGLQGNPKPDFKFLRELDTIPGRYIDNVNLHECTPDDLVNMSEEQFCKIILHEFIDQWLPNSKEQFLIK